MCNTTGCPTHPRFLLNKAQVTTDHLKDSVRGHLVGRCSVTTNITLKLSCQTVFEARLIPCC